MSREERLSAEFRAAPTEAQVLSICRTHHDDPARTAAFVAAVEGGSIQVRLGPLSAGLSSTLRMLGVRASFIGVRTPPTRPGYRHLKGPFLRGRLPGQIEAVFRARNTRPQKVLEFQRAVADGVIAIEPCTGLTRWHLSLLVKLGIPLHADQVRKLVSV